MTTSPEEVTARLRRLAALFRTQPPAHRVRMDKPSVTARLRSLSELTRLCERLGRGGTR